MTLRKRVLVISLLHFTAYLPTAPVARRDRTVGAVD